MMTSSQVTSFAADWIVEYVVGTLHTTSSLKSAAFVAAWLALAIPNWIPNKNRAATNKDKLIKPTFFFI